MKIAVCYDKGLVFQHFGKTKEFKIYEINNNEIINSYIISNNGITHCSLVSYLKENNVDCLICGGLGYGAISKLKELNIKLYAGVSGNADSKVLDLLNKKLEYDNEHICEDEQLHSCGSGINPLV